jgi:DNA-3-methyladenine glycosylase I
VWRFEPSGDCVDRAARPNPSVSDESKALAKDLKARGWRFVGPTTVYAFMQAMGLVNDHRHGCEARPAVDAARRRFTRP